MTDSINIFSHKIAACQAVIKTYVILTIIGSVVVSYSKSRGENFGVKTSVGLMQRLERFVLFGITSIFHPFLMVIFGITTQHYIQLLSR